jgi:predicted Mrr-cat superfamily restriction endonuclease
MVRYWVVRMTLGDPESNIFDGEVGIKENFVGIRWEKLGDLTGYTTKEGLKTLRDKAKKAYKNETSGTLNNWMSHINSFINRMKENDIVFLPIYPNHDPKLREYCVGKIGSAPYFRDDDKACVTNRRDVKWLITLPKGKLSVRLNKSLESPHSVYNIDKHEKEIQKLLVGKS